MSTIQELKDRATVIREETEQGANTAERVGGLLYDIPDYMDSLPDTDIVVDDSLSIVSKNPVQNKVITNRLGILGQELNAIRESMGVGGPIDGRINSAIATERNRATNAESELRASINTVANDLTVTACYTAMLGAAYKGLTQSNIIVGALPAEGEENLIYRVPGVSSYIDYMWDGTAFVQMAEYDNAIDDNPTYDSNNIVKSKGVDSHILEFCHAITLTDIVGVSSGTPKILKRFEGNFQKGQKCTLRLKNGAFTGTGAALAIMDDNNNTLAVINSSFFNEYAVEYAIQSTINAINIAIIPNNLSALTGDLYASITGIDANYSNSGLFLSTPIESSADCIKELYIDGLNAEQNYYLYVRKIGTNMYVQVTEELVNEPVPADLVAQADFDLTNKSNTISTLSSRNDSGISGICVAFPESVNGLGNNIFTTKGCLIKNGVVSNLKNFPICTMYSEGMAMYFTGLDMSQDYYLRITYVGSSETYYIQLATSATVTPENLVAQGTVTATGTQQLSSYNGSGINGLVVINSVAEFQPFKIDNVAATNGESIQVKVMLLENSIGKEITVRKSGGTYTSLLEGIIAATSSINSTVYVEEGTYDLVEEFEDYYGSSFFTTYTASSPKGIMLKSGVKVIFSSNAKVVFNYEGNNDTVKHEFSPFNSDVGGFTLENLTLKASNCRYCVHDERNSSEDMYVNKYVNCDMKLDNSNNNSESHGSQEQWGYFQVIGGGLGKNGEVEIKNCIFESLGLPASGYSIVSYHNTSISGAKSRIVLSENYLKGLGGFRLSWYGSSTLVTQAIVVGNRFGRAIEHRAENASAYDVHNTEIIEWNNIIETT